MTLNSQISQLRKQKKMSQEELAAALNVSRQAVSKWENGQSNPDTANFVRLAEIFEVDVNNLLGNTPAPQEERNFQPARPSKTVAFLAVLLCIAVCAAGIFAWLWQRQLHRNAAPSDGIYTDVKMYSGLTREEISLTPQEQNELIDYITRFHFVEAPPSDGKDEEGNLIYGGRNYVVQYRQNGIDCLWRFLEDGFSFTVTQPNGQVMRYHYAADFTLLYELDSYVY